MQKTIEMKDKKYWVKLCAIGAFMALFFFFITAPNVWAAEQVTGDELAKWILGWLKWGVIGIVGFNTIKQLSKGAYAVGLIVLVAGSILYFYMNDPQGFLSSLDFIPKFFTGK